MSEHTTDPGPGAAVAPGSDDQLIHEEFADPASLSYAPSHRRGMLTGLAGVGVLLAVLVLVAPGGSKPVLPPMVVHDVAPTASAPASASAPATTSSAPATTGTTTTSQPQSSSPAIVASDQTHSGAPVTTATGRPDTSTGGASTPSPAPTTTTAAPPPATTPTTSPPTTTTSPPPTTTTTSCLLGILCP
jgi:hypothetical protein